MCRTRDGQHTSGTNRSRMPRALPLASQSGLIYGTAPFIGIDSESRVLEQIVQKFRGVVLCSWSSRSAPCSCCSSAAPRPRAAAPKARRRPPRSWAEASRAANTVRVPLAGGENYPAEMAKQYKFARWCCTAWSSAICWRAKHAKLGFDISEDDVMQKVAEDGLIHLSMSVDAGPYLPPSGPQHFNFDDSKGKFSKENLRNFIQYRLRRSVASSRASRCEETLAQHMRDAGERAVTVSPGEAVGRLRAREGERQAQVRALLAARTTATRSQPTEPTSARSWPRTAKTSTPSTSATSTATPASRSKCARATS